MVGDTIIEDAPEGMVQNRPWGKGNSPKSAVREYMRRLEDGSRTDVLGLPLKFEINKSLEHKLSVTGSPDGFLLRL